jgi:uncharacterized protein YutE (UPF0331/DUF86 family)
LVDKSVILRKIADLETYEAQIAQYATITAQEYRDDWKIQRIVERTLQMMIEACVDIANHIVSDKGMRPPTSYADIFAVLREHAVIDAGLSDVMERMTKFRNVVVHQYDGVDAEIVIGILKSHLGDFSRFRDAVLAYLKKPQA